MASELSGFSKANLQNYCTVIQNYTVVLVVFVATIAISLTSAGCNPPRSSTDTSNSSQSEEILLVQNTGQTNGKSIVPSRLKELRIPDVPYDRNTAIASWILELDENKVGDWLEQTADSSWDVSMSTRRVVQELLLKRLVSSSPEQALNFALNRLGSLRSQLIETVFNEWAATDLTGALERAKHLSSSERSIVRRAIQSGSTLLTLSQEREIEDTIGSNDYVASLEIEPLVSDPLNNPRKLWYEIVEHAQPNQGHCRDLTDIALAWIRDYGFDVLGEVNSSLTDSEIQKHVLKRCLKALVESQPERTLEFAFETDFPDRLSTITEVVRLWAVQDPLSALNWIRGTKPSPFRTDLEFEIISELVKDDPYSLLQNLEELPYELRASVSSQSIEKLIWHEGTSRAAEIVAQLDERWQLEAARELVVQWLWSDRDATVEWVLNHPGIEGIRPRLLHSLSMELVDEDARLAFDLASTLPIPTDGLGLEGVIMSYMVVYDLSTAIDLLPEVRQGNTRTSAFVTVAKELLRSGRSEDAIDLGRQLTDQYATSYFYIQIGYAWARSNSEQFMDALDSFPTAQIRSRVAFQQVRWNHSTKWFTDQQVRKLETYLNSEHLAHINYIRDSRRNENQ